MNQEKVKQVLEEVGCTVVEILDNMFRVKLPTSHPNLKRYSDKSYEIYVPLKHKEGVICYNSRTYLNDPYLGMLSRRVEANKPLKEIEVAYLVHKGALEKYAMPDYGSWTSTQKVLIGKDCDTPDTGFYLRVSDCIEIELRRGLHLDIQRAQRKSGFIGFSATNGSLHNLIAQYCVFGEAVNPHRQGCIRYNREIDPGTTSELVDLANIPQDTSAVEKAAVVHGVVSVNGKLVHKKRTWSKSSYVLSPVPFRPLLNEKRMVVERAASQALNLIRPEIPIVNVSRAPKLSGRNAVVLRDPSLPADTFIVSESFRGKMFAAEPVVHEEIIPRNCQVYPVGADNRVDEDVLKATMAMGIARNSVPRHGVLFRYTAPGMGIAPTPIPEGCTPEERAAIEAKDNVRRIEAGIGSEKKLCAVQARVAFTPTKWEKRPGYSKGLVDILSVEGHRSIDLKVGSKLIDRFGVKGTVGGIRPDSEMPKIILQDGVEVTVDVMYNPSIYKKKIGLAYKLEECLGLDIVAKGGDYGTVPEFADRKQAMEFVRQGRGTILNGKRAVQVKMNGQVSKSFRAGIHFFHHLDHDPKTKLRFGSGGRTTFVDWTYLKKLHLISGENLDRANLLGTALGLKVEKDKKNDMIPQITRSPINIAPESYYEINKTIRRDVIHLRIDMLNPELLANTVADPRNDTMWGRVRLSSMGPNEDLWLPPRFFKTLITHGQDLVLPSALVALNAAVSENRSIEIKRDRGEDPSSSMRVLAGNIRRYKFELANRYASLIKESFTPRFTAIQGVASCNNELSLDEVGVPKHMLRIAERNGYLTRIAVLRRHPIHRIYNIPIVRMKPVDGYAIQCNEQLLAMLDGDSDGDLLELVLYDKGVPNPAQLARKYAPSGLMKSRTDISLKKYNNREARTSDLMWDQHDLKFYTALIGSMSIAGNEKAITAGWGYKLQHEVYHFGGQTSLNLKHNRRGIQLLTKLYRSAGKTDALEDYTDAIRELLPHLGERDVLRLRALYKVKADPRLQIVRKTVPYDVLQAIADGRPERIAPASSTANTVETRRQTERPGFLEHSASN